MPPAPRATTPFDTPAVTVEDTAPVISGNTIGDPTAEPVTAAAVAALVPTVTVDDLTDEQRAAARAAIIARFTEDVEAGALDADLPEVLTEENLGEIVDAALDAVVDVALADQTCPECGATVPDGEDTCPECGHQMAASGDAGTETISVDPANPGGFRAVLCTENERTADNRMIAEGAASWRTPPLAFMLMDTAGHGGMAGPSVLCGTIEEITRDGLSIIGTGRFLANDEMGTRAANLVANRAMTSNSIDGGDVEWEFIVEEVDEDGFPTKGLDLMTAVTILGSTLVPFPAIESAKVDYLAASGDTASDKPVITFDSRVEYLTPDALTAALTPPEGAVEAEIETTVEAALDAATERAGLVAGGVIRFPIAMFEDPQFEGPTPIQIDDDGHVFGHLALWGQCHTGFDRECVLAPRTRQHYNQFRTGFCRTDEGTNQPVGKITLGGGHAGEKMNADEARAHYDSTSTSVAYVNAGEDAYGIWLSGVLKPGISDETITELAASSLSGDWRNIGGNLELIAALAVNVPGFPVARVVNGEQLALVAAGYGHRKPTVSALEARLAKVAQTTEERLAESEANLAALRNRFDSFAAQVRPILAERMTSRFAAK